MKPDEQGFTLIEVVVVIGIFGLLMVAMLNLFDWHNKVFYIHQADTQATGSARNALNHLTKYIAQGTQIQASRTIAGTTYLTDEDTLVLQLPAYDSSSNLISVTYDYVVYDLQGNSLWQIIDADASSNRVSGSRLMSGHVASLTFTYDSGFLGTATKVTVDLETEAVARGSTTVSAHVANTIFLRNR